MPRSRDRTPSLSTTGPPRSPCPTRGCCWPGTSGLLRDLQGSPQPGWALGSRDTPGHITPRDWWRRRVPHPHPLRVLASGDTLGTPPEGEGGAGTPQGTRARACGAPCTPQGTSPQDKGNQGPSGDLTPGRGGPGPAGLPVTAVAACGHPAPATAVPSRWSASAGQGRASPGRTHPPPRCRWSWAQAGAQQRAHRRGGPGDPVPVPSPAPVGGRAAAYLTPQWAAVTTQFSLIRDPPQKWKPL